MKPFMASFISLIFLTIVGNFLVRCDQEETETVEKALQTEPFIFPGFGIPGLGIGFGNFYNGPFRCHNMFPGYYADIDRDCRNYHVCEPGGRHHYMQCGPGSVFNQWSLVCDYGYNYNCRRYAPQHYFRNKQYRPFERPYFNGGSFDRRPFDERRPMDRDFGGRRPHGDDRRHLTELQTTE